MVQIQPRKRALDHADLHGPHPGNRRQIITNHKNMSAMKDLDQGGHLFICLMCERVNSCKVLVCCALGSCGAGRLLPV